MVSSFSIILLKIKQKPKIHVFAVITFLDTPSSSPVFSLLSVYQIREEKANFVFFKFCIHAQNILRDGKNTVL